MSRAAQLALVAVLVLLGVLFDSVVFAPLDLPGAPPNVVLLIVAALALVFGSVGGAFTGFNFMVDGQLRSLFGIPDQVFIAGTVTLGRPMGKHGPVRRLVMGRFTPRAVLHCRKGQ